MLRLHKTLKAVANSNAKLKVLVQESILALKSYFSGVVSKLDNILTPKQYAFSY